MFIGGTNAATVPFDFGLGGKSHRDVEIVMSPAGGTIVGRAQNARDAGPDHSVIVFSADRADWFTYSARLRLVRAEPDGSFRASGLPPGEYWVERLDGPVAANHWQHPDALAQLSASARRVRVAEGQLVDTTLRIASGQR